MLGQEQRVNHKFKTNVKRKASMKQLPGGENPKNQIQAPKAHGWESSTSPAQINWKNKDGIFS